jgi:hypothetical protein
MLSPFLPLEIRLTLPETWVTGKILRFLNIPEDRRSQNLELYSFKNAIGLVVFTHKLWKGVILI